MNLGKVGLWTSALDRQPASVVRDAVARIEQLGYGTLWVGEAARREVFANASLLLAASTGLVVATGIANIWARDPMAMAAGQRTLAEAWDGRFLLGLGVSHDRLVNPRGHRYGRPVAAMQEYLDAMDAAPYDAPAPAAASLKRVLGALGPRMLRLAAEKCDGAHPYLVPTEHTRWARQILGPSKLLCPEVGVILDEDADRARRVARRYLSAYLSLTNYRANLQRLGYGEEEFADGGTDRLVDALIGWGTPTRVAARVQEHLDAGADHVAVQVLTDEPTRLPMSEWEILADALGR